MQPNPRPQSLYRTFTVEGQAVEMKSCPRCSVEAGFHVFYRLEAFGARALRGQQADQSWCKPCRNTPKQKGV